MNPRTRKIIDNQIWTYLEQLGMDAKNGEARGTLTHSAYWKLRKIAEVAVEISMEVELE
jgi:hypothetical protein